MKKVLIVYALILIILVVNGCDGSSKDRYKYEGVEMLQNRSLDLAPIESGYWWNNEGNYSQTFAYSIDYPTAGTKSLKINVTSSSQNPIFWAQTINTNIPVGKQLKLSAKIITTNLTGKGTSLVIRGDDSLTPQGYDEMIASTEGKISIKGNITNWKPYQVELTDKIISNIKSITVYLTVLPGSTGTVYFKDISLIY